MVLIVVVHCGYKLSVEFLLSLSSSVEILLKNKKYVVFFGGKSDKWEEKPAVGCVRGAKRKLSVQRRKEGGWMRRREEESRRDGEESERKGKVQGRVNRG